MLEATKLVSYLTKAEREELYGLVEQDLAAVKWRPLAGPQTVAYTSEADVIGFGGAAGGGKGLALDTLLPTPSGWVAMGQVRVGDQLLAPDGSPCTVTAATEPQVRPCYLLSFDDGTEVVADDVHRWVVKGVGMLDTTALRARLVAQPKRRPAIATAQALRLPRATLPVPPYTLGAWLGDGATAHGRLFCPDAGVWEHVQADGYELGPQLNGEACRAHTLYGLQVQLLGLGVLGNKHIPPAYLRASAPQRLALLQGIMDTDGSINQRGQCELSLSCERLAMGVWELLLSLGIKATPRRGASRLYGVRKHDRWRFKFTTTEPVFRLPRKAARLPQALRGVQYARRLVSCEPVGERLTRCVAVDSATRQYLCTRSFLPTHNTDLALGLALNEHHRVQIFRREAPQLEGIIDRLLEIVPSDSLVRKPTVYRDENVKIEFLSMPNAGDETKYQGRPKDLLVLDEASNFLESQVRFVKGWVRSTRPGQRKRTLLTFNPPTTSDGEWVIYFFGPWLDEDNVLYPTAPGQLRWCYVDPATRKDVWIEDDDPRRFVLEGSARVYDFDPTKYEPEQVITPESRTFIPSKISDNPYLLNTGYLAVLQAMPEPLRSQMLYGDFKAGRGTDPWQVCPTAWVQAAMDRWTERSPKGEQISVGVDVARGGRDDTVIALRYEGLWFDKPHIFPGKDTPDGEEVAGLVLSKRRDGAPIHIDVIGVGSSPYDQLRIALRSTRHVVIGVNSANKATSTSQDGLLSFRNMRSQLWWKFREALDPANDTGIALPPDPRLKRELCAPHWAMSGSTIYVESREELVKRIGNSPDVATAFIMALVDTPKLHVLDQSTSAQQVLEYDPYAHI